MGEFPVYYGSVTVGSVRTEIKGLYRYFLCTCKPPDEQVYGLFAEIDDRQEKIGICVSNNTDIYLDTKLPNKRFVDGPMVFALHPVHHQDDSCDGIFFQVFASEPFDNVHLLKYAYFAEDSGRKGLRITDCYRTAEDSADQKP